MLNEAIMNTYMLRITSDLSSTHLRNAHNYPCNTWLCYQSVFGKSQSLTGSVFKRFIVIKVQRFRLHHYLLFNACLIDNYLCNSFHAIMPFFFHSNRLNWKLCCLTTRWKLQRYLLLIAYNLCHCIQFAFEVI